MNLHPHRKRRKSDSGELFPVSVSDDWQVDYQHPQSLVMFLRRTTDKGDGSLLERTFDVTKARGICIRSLDILNLNLLRPVGHQRDLARALIND